MSLRPGLALFRNLGVNLRVSLCDVPEYVSAQTLDFLNLATNHSFPPRKPRRSHTGVSGWELASGCNLLEDPEQECQQTCSPGKKL